MLSGAGQPGQQQPDETELFVRGPLSAAFIAGSRLVYLRADGTVGVASLLRPQPGGGGGGGGGAAALLPSALAPTFIPCPTAASIAPVSSSEIAIVTAAGHLLLHSLSAATGPGASRPVSEGSLVPSLHAQIKDLAALAEQSTAVQHLAQALDERAKELNVLFHVLAAGSSRTGCPHGGGKALLRCRIAPSVQSDVLTELATPMASVTLEHVVGELFTSDRWVLLVTVVPAGASESLRRIATESHSEPLTSQPASRTSATGDRAGQNVCVRAPIPRIMLDHGIAVEVSCFLSYRLPSAAEDRPANGGGMSTESRLLLIKLGSRVLDVLDFVRPRVDGAPTISSAASISREVVDTFNRRGAGPSRPVAGTSRKRIAMKLVVHRDHAVGTIGGTGVDLGPGDLSAQLLRAILAETCFAVEHLADGATACSGVTLHGATFKLAVAPRGDGGQFFEISVQADSSACDELYLACVRRVRFDAETGGNEACSAASLRAMRTVHDTAKITEQVLLHQAANPQPRSAVPGLAPGSTPIAPLHDKLVQLVTGSLHATTDSFAR